MPQLVFTSSPWEPWKWDISQAPYGWTVLSPAWLHVLLTLLSEFTHISKHRTLFAHVGPSVCWVCPPHRGRHHAPPSPSHQLCSPLQPLGVLAVNSPSQEGSAYDQCPMQGKVQSTHKAPVKCPTSMVLTGLKWRPVGGTIEKKCYSINWKSSIQGLIIQDMFIFESHEYIY